MPPSANSQFDILPKPKPDKYVPDKNGYFVCKENVLITNKNLCKRYQFNKFDNSYNRNFNLNCSKCELDINKIKGKTLIDYNILNIELEQVIDELGSTKKYSNYHTDPVVLCDAEKQIEQVINYSNY